MRWSIKRAVLSHWQAPTGPSWQIYQGICRLSSAKYRATCRSVLHLGKRKLPCRENSSIFIFIAENSKLMDLFDVCRMAIIGDVLLQFASTVGSFNWTKISKNKELHFSYETIQRWRLDHTATELHVACVGWADFLRRNTVANNAMQPLRLVVNINSLQKERLIDNWCRMWASSTDRRCCCRLILGCMPVRPIDYRA